MNLKEIFKTKNETRGIDLNTTFNDNRDELGQISGASYSAKGTREAGLCGGSTEALLSRLNATYIQLTRYIQRDQATQNERKNQTRQEISNLEAKRNNFDIQLNSEVNKLEREESNIERILKEIENIKQNPKSISGENFTKISFYIGLIILVLLTVYLFVFYSSAAYSAFFKDFTPDDTKITQAIFDGQAVAKAWNDGFTELMFILLIPAVFLGLGFLIHKFTQEKGILGYIKILSLILVTFVFDFIIAYAIVKEIYEIKIGGIFQEMPPMSLTLAFKEVNFWIIIFAGFVVYLIWGLVFSFTMKEYERMDAVRFVLRNKEQKLAEYKKECKTIKEKITELEKQKNEIQGDIDKLKIQLESYILYFNDVREGINNYFSGWVGFLRSTNTTNSIIEECEQIKDDFLSQLRNSDFIRTDLISENN